MVRRKQGNWKEEESNCQKAIDCLERIADKDKIVDDQRNLAAF